MGEALVTKLKAAVENDNLLKLGEFVLHINSNASNIGMNIQGISSAKVRGNGFIGKSGTPSSTELEFTSEESTTGTILFSAGTYDVICFSKYGITGMGDAQGLLENDIVFDVDDMDYCLGNAGFWLKSSQIENGSLNLNSMLSKYFVQVGKIGGYNYTANINKVQSSCIGLVLPNESGVTGDIDTMAQGMVADGRTSGTMTLKLLGTSCTDGGNPISNEIIRITFNNGSYTKSYS